MKFELYSEVALASDIPQYGLQRGDVVKLVDEHQSVDGTRGYSIEVFNAIGETIAVTSVSEDSLEQLRNDEILCARTLHGS